MHVHNNYKDYDQHGSVLRGTVDYNAVFQCLESLQIAPIMSTEMFDIVELTESLDFLQAKMKNSKIYNT